MTDPEVNNRLSSLENMLDILSARLDEIENKISSSEDSSPDKESVQKPRKKKE